MSKIDASFIDDIFGIPRDGSNIGEDDGEAYAGLGTLQGTVTFEEKAKELEKDIAKAVAATPEKMVEKVSEKKEIVTIPEKKEEVQTAMKNAVPADPTSPASMFGDIFGDEEVKQPPKVEPKAEVKVQAPKVEAKVEPKVEKKADVAKEEPKVEAKASPVVPAKTETADDSGIKAQPQPSQPSAPLVIGGKATKHKWTLDAPSVKYQHFYNAKREALEGALLKGGELPFDQYYMELEEANVDVSVGETFQGELVCQKMAECQKYRERIKQVQLRVNRQFFQWERHMDLFGGLLARIEEVRGVDKRDGIKYEHMYDMESYFGELKSLYKSIDNVMRNLDSAFECLSRQVTVTMPMKDIERYNTGPKPMTPTLQRYDGLKTHANGSSSIGTSRSKDSPKGDESPTESGWGIVK